jgi:hypothetical protein
MTRGRFSFFVSISLAIFLFAAQNASAAPASANVPDADMAERVASLLGEKFSPESLLVTVKGNRAYAEMNGAVVSGIRIDSMRLDAFLTNRGTTLSDDVDALASLVESSKGEIVLLEDDVNAYFEANEQSGFSDLRFDFSPSGFTANGMFNFLTLRMKLAAKGILSLGQDGVYLENVTTYVENIKQPDALTKQITSRVNPLLAFSDIPFDVAFDTVAMDGHSVKISGTPVKFAGGSSAEWKRAAKQ